MPHVKVFLSKVAFKSDFYKKLSDVS